MQITKKPSPHHDTGRAGHTPDFIVLHTTGSTTGSAVNTVTNPTSQVSYHFIVAADGTVTRHVAITDTAWAAGTTTDGGSRDPRHSPHPVIRGRRYNANLYTVNIGFGDMNLNNWTLTTAQIDAAGRLFCHIADEVRRVYGHEIPLTREFIIGHDEIVPRHRPNCPGSRFPWDDVMQSADMPSEWARAELAQAVAAGITDGTRPQAYATRQEVAIMVLRGKGGQP